MHLSATLWLAPLFAPMVVANANQQTRQEKVQELAEKRLTAARAAFDAWFKLAKANEQNDRITQDRMYHLSIRVLDAELSLTKQKEARVAAYEGHLGRMRDWENLVVGRVKLGAAPAAERVVVESYRVEAEYWLEQAK